MIENELKPMDLGGLIDKTFRLIIANMKNFLKIFWVFFGITMGIALILAALVVGIVLYYNGFEKGLSELPFAMTQGGMLPALAIGIPVFIVLFVVLIIVSLIYYGMTFDLYIKAFLGQEWDFKRSFDSSKSKIGTIFATSMLSSLIMIGGIFLCCIGMFIFAIFLSFAFPIIMYEERKATDAISRSFNLVKGNFWFILVAELIIGLILSAISAVLQVFSFAIGGLAPFIEKGGDINVGVLTAFIVIVILFIVATIVLSIISSAIQTAFFVILYFNERIKQENFGVEKLAETMISDMETSTDENSSIIKDDKDE